MPMKNTHHIVASELYGKVKRTINKKKQNWDRMNNRVLLKKKSEKKVKSKETKKNQQQSIVIQIDCCSNVSTVNAVVFPTLRTDKFHINGKGKEKKRTIFFPFTYYFSIDR